MGAAQRLIWDKETSGFFHNALPGSLANDFICAPVPLQKQKSTHLPPRFSGASRLCDSTAKPEGLTQAMAMALAGNDRLSCKRFRTDATL